MAAANHTTNHHVVTTAVAWVLTNEQLIKDINAIRQQHDRAFLRWPPHITLFFPFVHHVHLDNARTVLTLPVHQSERFEITFKSVGHFKQSRGATFHLIPDEASRIKLQQIHAACATALQHGGLHAIQNHSSENTFYPHLTLAQCQRSSDIQPMRQTLESWLGHMGSITTCVEHICILERSETDNKTPFVVHSALPLASK